MKRIALLAALFCLLAPIARADTSLFAKNGRFGLGLGGTNLVSGLTGKLFISNPVALQATLGYWYGDFTYGYAVTAIDAVVEMPSFFHNDAVNLNWNVGGGATVVLGAPFLGGLQGVAGIGLQLRPVPLEFVLELRPTFLFPGARFFYFGGGAAIRFFFG